MNSGHRGLVIIIRERNQVIQISRCRGHKRETSKRAFNRKEKV